MVRPHTMRRLSKNKLHTHVRTADAHVTCTPLARVHHSANHMQNTSVRLLEHYQF